MHTRHTAIALVACLLALSYGCGSQAASESEDSTANAPVADVAPGSPLFKLLEPESTGITFQNILQENDEVNFYAWDYLYNGGGVAIGDLNNDGLPDLYLTGTISPDKLYLNKGNLQFEDVTESSGIGDRGGLKTGVNMVDINNDGLLDIYVCRSGFPEDKSLHQNLLFINMGDMQFEERAKDFGLNDAGNSVHSAFFDYDLDGDLDCYITAHPGFRLTYDDVFAGRAKPDPLTSDKLYRNNGDGTYTNYSERAGIANFGHGLGLGVSDFDNDGYPDIYVANDFQLPDFYYHNNGNGTFTEQIAQSFPHCSYFSMGLDIADIDQDGWLDMFIVEMLAADNKRKKTNMAPMNAELFWKHVDAGFHYQYMRNVLQRNNGSIPGLDNGCTFTDIADQAGVRNTDWSWAPMFADFDHDGKIDLLVTNGYLKDTQDKDYTKESEKLAAKRGGTMKYQDLEPLMKSTRLPNFAFRNDGDYQFSDVSNDWGFNFSGYSNGATYGDLDGDGDLDVVVNNFHDPASVYENTAANQGRSNVVRVKLEGPDHNKMALGSKVKVITNKGQRYAEHQNSRGFQSAADPTLHFGLAEGETVQSIEVIWPNRKAETFNAPESNSVATLSYGATGTFTNADFEERNTSSMFRPLTSQSGALFTHRENDFDDYEREILLPHKQSQNGPALAVADVNGDGLDDFYVGGAAGQPGVLFGQNGPMGLTTVSSATFAADMASEDVAAHFFDSNGDGNLDLYVVSGGNEFAENAPELQDRLYIGDGKGNFKRSANAIPNMPTSGGAVASADFDGDGDLDLFVGGGLVPGKYPFPPRSYLLQNDNGKFTDVTSTVAPELMNPGLIRTAIWTDYNGDQKPDLMLGGEWTTLLVYANEGGKLVSKSEALGLGNEVGWWFEIEPGDFDGDGDIDYIAGNLGLNYKYRGTKEAPFQIYCHDFDESGTFDIVLGYYNEGECFPVRGRQCSSEQMPFITEKFPTYDAFGEANLTQVYGDDLKDALHYEGTNFASCYIENKGNGKLELHQLPAEAQFAPIRGAVTMDFNGDGHLDVIVAGNLFPAEVETPRADGGTGLLMLGDGKGGFKPLSMQESGIIARADVRDIALVNIGPGNPPLLVVANNDSDLQLFLQNATNRKQN